MDVIVTELLSEYDPQFGRELLRRAIRVETLPDADKAITFSAYRKWIGRVGSSL